MINNKIEQWEQALGEYKEEREIELIKAFLFDLMDIKDEFKKLIEGEKEC